MFMRSFGPLWKAYPGHPLAPQILGLLGFKDLKTDRFGNPKTSFPRGSYPSTQYLRLLVPKTITSMVFGTRDLKYWVLGPLGLICTFSISPSEWVKGPRRPEVVVCQWAGRTLLHSPTYGLQVIISWDIAVSTNLGFLLLVPKLP